jgi:hypothetical protein
MKTPKIDVSKANLLSKWQRAKSTSEYPHNDNWKGRISKNKLRSEMKVPHDCFDYLIIGRVRGHLCWAPNGRSGRSALMARRFVRAESVRVLSFLRDLLARSAELAQEVTCNGSKPRPLYIWRATADWMINNRINNQYISRFTFYIRSSSSLALV